jgi:hypothetical protein
MLFLSIYCVFLLSLGSFELKKQFALYLLFQNMWEHLTHGSLAVDKDLIGMEGFEVNGITTAYFLPFPSLIRGLLSIIGYGESAILSVLLGALVFLSSSLLIWRLICKVILKANGAVSNYYWICGALVCTLLSPMLGMMSFPTAFWEAIIWASTLFLLASYLSIYTLQNYFHNKGSLFAFTLICGLSLFTRATFSFTSCLLYGMTILFIIILEKKRGLAFKSILGNPLLIANILIFATFLGALLTFNYAKWGNPFEFYPLQYYKMWSEEQKLRYFSHGALNLSRLPQTLAYYFLPASDNFSSIAPFINMGSSAQFGSDGIFDYKEPRLAISLTEPIPVILFLVGLISLPWAVLKHRSKIHLSFIPAALISLIPIIFILSIHSLSIRYAGDFLPAIMIFGLFGLSQIILFGRKLFITPVANQMTGRKFLRAPLAFIAGTMVICSLYLSASGVLLQNEMWKYAFLNFNLIPIHMGETVSFRHHGNNDKGNGYLQTGWSLDLEEFGTWSNAKTATLLVSPPSNFKSDNSLIIKARGFVTQSHPEQIIDIWVNGKLNQTVKLTNPEINEIEIKAPFSVNWLSSPKYIGISLFNYLTRSVGTPNQEPIFIKFEFRNPAKPKDLGLGDDERLLGIGLISVTLQ